MWYLWEIVACWFVWSSQSDGPQEHCCLINRMISVLTPLTKCMSHIHAWTNQSYFWLDPSSLSYCSASIICLNLTFLFWWCSLQPVKGSSIRNPPKKSYIPFMIGTIWYILQKLDTKPSWSMFIQKTKGIIPLSFSSSLYNDEHYPTLFENIFV